MSHPKDETGKRYFRLKVLSREKNGANGRARWLCECDCGGKVVATGFDLRRNDVKSCGCLHREAIGKRSIGSTHSIKHGMHGTSTYGSWVAMKSRCSNRKLKEWPRYGGRGIRVCDRWLESFENFLADMGEKPTDGWHIDRIDTDGNYEPGNCQWLSPTEHAKKTNQDKAA